MRTQQKIYELKCRRLCTFWTPLNTGTSQGNEPPPHTHTLHPPLICLLVFKESIMRDNYAKWIHFLGIMLEKCTSV